MRTHPSAPGMLRRVTGKLVSLVYRRNGFNPLPIIAFDFASLIIVGSILLSLPIASAGPEPVSWFDALFTSTSAVCVTGLVVVDTGTAYSTFGHVVLLTLIQIGGLSFMAFATLFFWLMGKTLSLKDRMLMRDSFNEDVLGGVSRLVRWVILSTFFLELTGAALFAIRFIPLYGPKRGLFYAIFHAVSAYCNAGFDLFGGGRSLTGFSGDALVNMTAISLVVLGGLGFGVLADIRDNRRFRRLKLHTKL
ncbi:MAG: potassium transporter TrkG, partial [bacterium]